jgi:acylphosphatase
MIHKNIRIFGSVQGVGFRYTARNTAASYGIKGYVKNMPDGSVYIESEGPEKNVLEFVQWCRTGSDYSFVDHIEVEDADLEYFSTFDIRF